MKHEAIISTALRIDPFGEDGTLYKLASSSPETLSALVAAFVADEREACAKTCEGISHMASSNAPVLCAMEIRARSRHSAALAAPAAEPEAMGDEPELPHTIYGLFYEEPGSISEQDEGYQEFLDEAGYTADQLRTYAKQYAQWHTTAQAGGLPEGWQFRVLSPGSITVQTESGYSCTLWKSGHGGVEALAYQMADMLRKSLTAAPQAPALDADPLQGAANWIVSATSYDRATHIAEIQQRLLIGYNRASRLYDAAMSAPKSTQAERDQGGR